MSFFSLQELKEISNRIGCDVFVKRGRLMSEAKYIKSSETGMNSIDYEDDLGYSIITIEELENEKEDKDASV